MGRESSGITRTPVPIIIPVRCALRRRRFELLLEGSHGRVELVATFQVDEMSRVDHRQLALPAQELRQ